MFKLDPLLLKRAISVQIRRREFNGRLSGRVATVCGLKQNSFSFLMHKIKIRGLERYANVSPLITYPPDITGKHFCWGRKKEAWKMTERSHFKFQIQLGIRDGLHNCTLITIPGLNNLWFKVGFIEQGVLWDLTLHLLLKASSTQRHSFIIKVIHAT